MGLDSKLAVTLLLLAAMFAGNPEHAAAQSVPGMAGTGLANARVIDSKEARSTDPFAIIHDKPMSESAAIIPLLQAGADVMPPQYLYELARRLWPTDRNAAFEWLALGMARARYDALRCSDKTARQGIGFLPMIAPDVVKGIEQERKAFGEAGKRALARRNLFVDAISPMWICSHGMAIMNAAIQGKRISESDWQTPASEWPALREAVRSDLARYFDEQDKPQDDPAPPTKTRFPRHALPGSFNGPYAWLDDQRLVVATTEKGSASTFVRRLVVVDSDGRHEEVAMPTGIWCAGNGVISYETGAAKLDKKTERLTFAVGRPGQWQEQSLELQRPYLNLLGEQTFSQSWSLPVNSTRQSPFDCRWETSEKLSGPGNATQWLPLLPGEGAIKFDPPSADSKQRGVSWVREGGGADRLALPAAQLSLNSFRYFTWRKAYFVAPIWSRFAADSGKPPACMPAAWIHPQQQRIEEVCVPFDTANTSNAVMFSPSRAGWLRVASSRITAHGPKPGGLYLVRPDGRTEKLVETQIDSWNVAPDGCRVAFRHREGTASPATLEILDLCQAS